MLGDRHSRYIITKNNKPLRAVIDYAEYEHLKKNIGDQFFQTPHGADADYPGHVEGDAGTEGEKKTRKSKSRVPGILESNSALSDSTPDKRHRAQPKAEERAKETLQHEQQAGASEDYFSTASLADAEPNLIPPIDETIIECAVAPEPPPQFKQETKPQKFPTETEKERPTPKKPETKKESGEEEEYFRKYRKLYETLGGGSLAPADDNQPQDMMGEGVGLDIENELEPTGQNERSLIDERAEAESNIDAEKHAATRAPQTNERAQAREGRAAQENGEELPSLKDLLASLEQEKLSGEDEEVDESQIEDLIQRITED
jgi:hypothetical protein